MGRNLWSHRAKINGKNFPKGLDNRAKITILYNMNITKEIKVSSILTDEVLRQRDELLAQGFKHVNNVKTGRLSDGYTMILVKLG